MSTRSTPSHHAFLSYSHKDRDIAVRLYRWLTRDAGYQIWFDEHNLGVGSPVATTLAEKMNDSRAWIVLASKNSVASSWVRAEHDQALHCAAENPAFHPIVLRIDDIDLKQKWPSVERFSWLEVPGGILTPAAARNIIDRLDNRQWSGRQTGLRDIYVSRGWRESDLPFADAVCAALCGRKWGLRLVGDAPDQASFSDERIRPIIAGCYGHLVILPRRGTGGAPTDHDYRYILRELALSRDLGIPSVLLAENGTPLPPSLISAAVTVPSGNDYAGTWTSDPPAWLEFFTEDLKEPPLPQHVFLAAEFKENMERVASLREFIEAVTGLPCRIGRDFQGQGLHAQIIAGIVSASVVLADLGTFTDGAPGSTGVHVNTCVEGGIAIGASGARDRSGGKPLPVLMMAQCAPDVKGKTARLPFMFRDSQITWYADDTELLGHCRRLLQPFRRRIMNYEFTQPP